MKRAPFMPYHTIATCWLSLCVGVLCGRTVPADAQAGVMVEMWTADHPTGGWGGPHNATIAEGPEGAVLKAGEESYYGSCFRGIGEVDLDRFPYLVAQVDQAEGPLMVKLINGALQDKQVVLDWTPGDGVHIVHLPSRTGWSGLAPFTIGIYVRGEGKSIHITKIEFVAQPSKDALARWNQMQNLLMDAGFEIERPDGSPLQTWHRCGDYRESETPWRVVRDGAFDGKQCLATRTPGAFVLQREIHARGSGLYTFSVYLKAASAGHKARISVATYRQGRPFVTDTETKDVTVGTDWERYSMTVDVPPVRNRGVLGPVDLTVESLDEGELRLDAVQFENGGVATLFGTNASLMSYERLDNLRSPLYPAVPEPPAAQQGGPRKSGHVALHALEDAASLPRGWPMRGAVSLPQGECWETGDWHIAGAGATLVPSQTRVLARWKGDGSVKCAELVAESDGRGRWGLLYGSKPPPRRLGEPLRVHESDGAVRIQSEALQVNIDKRHFGGPELGGSGVAGFVVTSLDGREFSSTDGDVASVRVEDAGPLQATVRIEGDHRSAQGEHLLSYVARVHVFRAQPLVRLEYTWINTNASRSVAVRSIQWRLPLGDGSVRRVRFIGEGDAVHEVDVSVGPASITQLDVDRRYFYELQGADGKVETFDGKAAGWAELDLGEQVLQVAVEDWWQNHPLELSADRDGLTISFWPSSLKAVELTQGMSKTYVVNLWLGPKANAPECMMGPARLAASPEVYCRSGVFGGQILPHAGSPFPRFEKAVESPACLGRMGPESLAGGDCYGQFNYGDAYGDGGWCNLETQRGHAMWLHYIRTGRPEFFAIAQAAARHYRDIDIDQLSGATITHNPSHTLGGKSTSHAWIQSLLDHYMTTGERRSMEVALLHAEYLKNLSLDSLTQGGRTVTRVLDNMADLYMLTGDEALVAKYHEICDFQRRSLAAAETPFPGLFQSGSQGTWIYPANFVPWYGLYSIAKMRLATGDAQWEQFMAEETAVAMSVQPYEHSRPEYFRDNPLTTDQRIIRTIVEGKIGDRGNMLFPALGYAYRWTGDKRHLEMGMTLVYAAILSREYTDPLYALAAVFLQQAREAGFGQEEEEAHYKAALDVMLGMAHEQLANPGFEQGTKHWGAWRVKATTSNVWKPIREKALLMDRAVKKEGEQSLHVVITRQNPRPGFSVPLESDDIVLKAGATVRIEGWVRTEGDVYPSFSLSCEPLSGDVAPQSFKGTAGEPDGDGWQRWIIEAQATALSLGRVRITINRKSPTAEGEAWIDGIAMTQDVR